MEEPIIGGGQVGLFYFEAMAMVILLSLFPILEPVRTSMCQFRIFRQSCYASNLV